MQYFQAVQQGRQRAAKSQMKLFDIAGFAMLTLTTKKVNDGFVPVGEEDFAAVIQTRDGYVAILADGDGKTKAQTKALEKNEDTIAGGYDLMDIVALKVIERSRIKTRILKADTAILERVIKGGSGGTEIIHSKKKRAR